MSKTNERKIDDNTLKVFCQKILSLKTYSEIESIVSEYKHFNHPHIYYMAASMCHVINQYEQGLPWLKKTISYGTNFPNKYWDTLHADAIGSSIAILLREYDFDIKISKMGNLFTLGYCFLSNTIEQIGNKAYESIDNRGHLFNPGLPAHSLFIMHKVKSPWVLPVLCEVFSISDYLNAAKGYYMIGDNINADKIIGSANSLHEWLEDISVAGKDADEYSLQEIADIGTQRHKELFDFYKKDLLLNKYTINSDELDNIFDSISIK